MRNRHKTFWLLPILFCLTLPTANAAREQPGTADTSKIPRPAQVQQLPVQPGNPRLPSVPDLRIETIDVTWTNESPCIGPQQANFNVAVTIRNAGYGPATMPTWKPWLLVWSIKGGTNPLYQAHVVTPPAPAQLAPGQSAVLMAKLAAFAVVSPDKSKSTVGIGAIVDPEKQITESNEGNNMQEKQLTFGGVLCPVTGQ